MAKPRPKADEAHSETVGVSEFKSRCLELVERTHRDGQEYVVTKHGEPVARLIPIRPVEGRLRGLFKGQMFIHGDIVNVDWSDEWEAAR